MNPDAYLYDALRTPRGKGKTSGSLYVVKPLDLLVTVIEALRARNGFPDEVIDDVIIGCVTQTGDQGACIARTAVLKSGLDDRTPGQTVNRFCGSALETVNQAAALVSSGFQRLIIAGGVESMSRVKMGADGGAMFDAELVLDRGIVPQGISADLLATLRGITRGEVDAFALQSQMRTAEAQREHRFRRGIVPVRDSSGLTVLDVDEFPRPETTLEGLNALRPSFKVMGEKFGMDEVTRKVYPELERINHIHHAGNSSGIVDGAAAVLVGNKAAGESFGLKPRARIRAFGVVGDEPVLMLSAPMPASERALKMAGMQIGDIDLIEVNEAFAAVPLSFMEHFGIDDARVNVNGGAIALGHPLGATGAMLLSTALDAIEDRDLNTALVTLCIGGGMGIATIIERV